MDSLLLYLSLLQSLCIVQLLTGSGKAGAAAYPLLLSPRIPPRRSLQPPTGKVRPGEAPEGDSQ